jgi:hypothetical protein
MVQENDYRQTILPGDNPDIQAVPNSPQDLVDDVLELSAELAVEEVFDGAAVEAVEDALGAPLIMKEIDAIFENQPDDMFSVLYPKSKPEVVVSPASRELYAQADTINKLRADLLGRKFFNNAV